MEPIKKAATPMETATGRALDVRTPSSMGSHGRIPMGAWQSMKSHLMPHRFPRLHFEHVVKKSNECLEKMNGGRSANSLGGFVILFPGGGDLPSVAGGETLL